jgi:hypothetical protein
VLTHSFALPFTMVAYCTTALGGGTCTDIECPQRHDISRCESCNCAFPTPLLSQHQSGKKHLHNVASNGPPNSGTTWQSPSSQPGPPNAQLAPPPNTTPLSSGRALMPTADPRFTVSDEGGLDFIVEGMGDAENPSFSSANHTIVITKTEERSRIFVTNLVLSPLPNP